MKLEELTAHPCRWSLAFEGNMSRYYGSDGVDMKKLKRAISNKFDDLDAKTQDALVGIYHWLELNEKDLTSKKKVIATLLGFYKMIDHNDTADYDIVKQLIENFRTLGIDYPEFKSIEKSMESQK